MYFLEGFREYVVFNVNAAVTIVHGTIGKDGYDKACGFGSR